MNHLAPFVLGTRKSILARWQTDHVKGLLKAAWPQQEFTVEIFTTKGDKIQDTPLPLIGGKGLFTLELENALHAGEIDMAVHSLKDLPTESPDGLTIGAIPKRELAGDALVSRGGQMLEALPNGATVGTSSRRRAAQLLHIRPDLQIIDIRGNVDTRIAKTMDPNGPYDATILAEAGLIRMGRKSLITQVLSDEIMLPAPGQGALGIQCRDEIASTQLLAPLANYDDTAEVVAERAFLAGLGGGCSTPVAARGRVVRGQLTLIGRVTAPDGATQVQVSIEGNVREAVALGQELARMALRDGAAQLIAMPAG